MKNPYEVLREKESRLRQVETEVEALRIVAPLLGEESNSKDESKSAAPQGVTKSA